MHFDPFRNHLLRALPRRKHFLGLKPPHKCGEYQSRLFHQIKDLSITTNTHIVKAILISSFKTTMIYLKATNF
jgi:hypothetical protein